MYSYRLTVIIPHKDIPELLRRCLASVPRRSDVQVIVADDHSECDVKSMLSQWGMDHVELLRTERPSGGGGARNLGLTRAAGEWITFLDADDYFTPAAEDIIDSLRSVAEDVDVVYCAGCSVDSVTYVTSDRADWLNRHIALHESDAYESEMRLRYTFGEPWCKIVRRALIDKHHINFDVTRIHNDTRYSYLAGHYARVVKVDSRALCVITTRAGSVSRTLTEENKLQRIEVFAREYVFFEQQGIPHKYMIRFLWAQMARSLFENKDTFRQGVGILRRLGVRKSKIFMMTAKHVLRNAMVRRAKKILEKFR